MSSPIILSPTLNSDTAAIELLLDLSFGVGRRSKSSYLLREGSLAVPGLSYVVRDDEFVLAGAISYWPLVVGVQGTKALLLGPLAVHPERQNLGIGLALMRETLAKAKTQGHRLVLLVGDLPYYARVGFQQVPEGKLQMPGPVDPKRLLALELERDALLDARGMIMAAHRFVGGAASKE